MPPDNFAHVAPFHVWENAFTPAELDSIEAHCDGLNPGRGTVKSSGAVVIWPMGPTVR